MAKKNEELATVDTNSALAEVVDFGEFAADAATLRPEDYITERWRLVQALTKAKQENRSLQDGDLYGNLNKKGLKKALIVEIFQYRAIVERQSKANNSKFVREYVESTPNNFGDARVNQYVAAAGFKDVYKVNTDNGNELVPTYNSYVAFLNETGDDVVDFGILQADKTQIRPYKLWCQNRVKFNGANGCPTYAIRTWVDGQADYKNEKGNVTKQYTFTPFVNNDWRQSLLNPKTNRELLLKLAEHKKLMQSGAIKVAEYSDADDSEAAQEEAAF